MKRTLFPGNRPIEVQSGPFRGMHYLDEVVWGSITPKWLGSYEAELHPVITHIVERGYTTVIDVGCAEGYYAVGLALALPQARIFAFDSDFLSRKQVSRLSHLNHVSERVSVGGFCSHSALQALLQPNALLICDIEGYEADLLDPSKVPAIQHADILVEVHEASLNSFKVEELLCARFAKSHSIERLAASERSVWVASVPEGISRSLPADTLLEASEEHRANGRVWLWMRTLE